jgi:hypothetical protein
MALALPWQTLRAQHCVEHTPEIVLCLRRAIGRLATACHPPASVLPYKPKQRAQHARLLAARVAMHALDCHLQGLRDARAVYDALVLGDSTKESSLLHQLLSVHLAVDHEAERLLGHLKGAHSISTAMNSA